MVKTITRDQLENDVKNLDLVIIVGMSASGKSYFSRDLAKKTGVNLIEVDKLIEKFKKVFPEGLDLMELYQPNKYPKQKEELIKDIKNAMKGHNIVDGRFWDPKMIRELIRGKTYKLIYLKPPKKSEYVNRIKNRVLESEIGNVLMKNEVLGMRNDKAINLFVNEIVNNKLNGMNEELKVFEPFNLSVLVLKN